MPLKLLLSSFEYHAQLTSIYHVAYSKSTILFFSPLFSSRITNCPHLYFSHNSFLSELYMLSLIVIIRFSLLSPRHILFIHLHDILLYPILSSSPTSSIVSSPHHHFLSTSSSLHFISSHHFLFFSLPLLFTSSSLHLLSSSFPLLSTSSPHHVHVPSALGHHPCHAGLWVLAAAWEAEGGNVMAARGVVEGRRRYDDNQKKKKMMMNEEEGEKDDDEKKKMMMMREDGDKEDKIVFLLLLCCCIE